jgi:Carboxypeptidase regulatory-like domain
MLTKKEKIRPRITRIDANIKAGGYNPFALIRGQPIFRFAILPVDVPKSFDRYDLAKVYLLMRLREFSMIVGFVVMAASISLGQTPSGTETGIEGVIMISPAQPGPIRADSPGSIPLANAAFVVENEKSEVASFTTDDQGRFRISVPPGHYKVSIKGKRPGIGRYGPFEVDVAPGKMTKVEWECDSGIR